MDSKAQRRRRRHHHHHHQKMVTPGGRPSLVSTKLHDEEEGGAVGVIDREAIALRHGSPCGPHQKVSRSGGPVLSGPGRHKLSGSSCYEVSGFGRHEQCGLPPRHSRVLGRLGSAGLGTIATVDERPYACTDCSMTFGREMVLCGHMRSHKRGHLSSDPEKDAPTPKRRKEKSKLRTVKPLELQWGSHARRNGIPRDAHAEVKVSESEFDHSSNAISVNIDYDDDNANVVITVTGSHEASGLASDAVADLAMSPTPTVVVATPTSAPHTPATSMNTEGAPTVSTAAMTIQPAPASTVATNITIAPLATTVSAATQSALDWVKGNSDFSQAGARYRYGENDKAFARNNNCGKSLASYSNVEYGNGVAGHSDGNHRGKGVSGCSSGSHTYNTSTPAQGESNNGRANVYSCEKCNRVFHTPQAMGGHMKSHRKIVEKGNNGSGEARARTIVVLALPALRAPVHQPPQGIMAMADNPVAGHFPAANTSTAWSFPATTSSFHPSIPLQNHGSRSFNINTSSTPTHRPSSAAIDPYQAVTEVNSNAAAIDALACAMHRLSLFQTGRSAIKAPPMPMPTRHPTKGMTAIVSNSVTGHFPAGIVGNGCSFPTTTSSVLPTIGLQTQEENPPQGRVVPANELGDPSQNQVENPLEGTVPGNNRGRTIRLFGTNITEDQKEVKEPTN